VGGSPVSSLAAADEEMVGASRPNILGGTTGEGGRERWGEKRKSPKPKDVQRHCVAALYGKTNEEGQHLYLNYYSREEWSILSVEL
jgi:hypothetical protein